MRNLAAVGSVSPVAKVPLTRHLSDAGNDLTLGRDSEDQIDIPCLGFRVGPFGLFPLARQGH